MFPAEYYDTHIERIQAAVRGDGPVAGFYGQIQAIYSTMAVLDITKFLIEQKFITFNREEIDNRFYESVPYANLAYVMRIQDFHRGGLVKPEQSGMMRMYGIVHVATRQSHGIGYVEVSCTGELTKVRKNNSKVELDKPLLQSGWSFRTEDMSKYVDIMQVNTDNYNGMEQFLLWIGYPRS